MKFSKSSCIDEYILYQTIRARHIIRQKCVPAVKGTYKNVFINGNMISLFSDRDIE